jgi:hypothetical protein
MATPKKILSPRIDEPLYEELRQYAEARRWSLAQSMAILLEEALRRDRERKPE